MDISGAVVRRAALSSGLGFRRDAVADRAQSAVLGAKTRVSVRPRRAAIGGGVAFSDEGHVAYYVRCGGGKKCREDVKKRAKLVKGMVQDLAALCDESRENSSIQEAAQRLMTELNQLRAQEEEMKRMKKEEKYAMKASKMKKVCAEDESSSSSSESSESSDSEGECQTVMNMKNLKTAVLEQKPESSASSVCSKVLQPQTEQVIDINLDTPKITQECCNTSINSGIASVVVEKSADKIEVCMGGKCKKSGAVDLLQEFEKNIGIEGAVVGCKCMGKCKEGPNVRVRTQANNEDLSKGLKNPLCIGVRLEDVPDIVANFFGDDKEGMGLMAA